MGYCANCGRHLERPANYCPFCGQDQYLKEEEYEAEYELESDDYDDYEPETYEAQQAAGSALKFAILGLIFSFFGIVGLILSSVARGRISRYRNIYPYDVGKITAASVLSIIGIILSILWILFGIIYTAMHLSDITTTFNAIL